MRSIFAEAGEPLKMKKLPLFCLFLSVSFVSCEKNAGVKPSVGVNFVTEIKPLLSSTCVPCHNSQTLLGGLSLESRKTAFGGRAGGAFLVPGDPDSSLIYRVTENPHGKQSLGLEKMPAMKDISLTSDERGLLRRWIEEGAKWPSGDDGWLKPMAAPNQES